VLALWAAITLSVGVWQVVTVLDEADNAGRAGEYAAAGLSTVTLIERLQDERDVASQVQAADSDNPKLLDAYQATDRARSEFESAARSLPRDTFGQVDGILDSLGRLEKLRVGAFASGTSPTTTITGYGDLIMPLVRLTERATERAVTLSRLDRAVPPTSGVAVLLVAAEALSQQRTSVTTILARDSASEGERQELRTVTAVARESLEAFATDAAPPILRIYERADDEGAAAEANRFVTRIVEDAGPYLADGLLPATWASVSSDRLNQIRMTVWTAAVDLIDRVNAELDRHRLAVAVRTVIGVGTVLIAGIAVISCRRLLFARPPGPPPAASRPGWQDPLPCRLSRRTQELLNDQLDLIGRLESTETDPARLATLFQLDNLATRMRRHGENLASVTGQLAPRHWPRPLPLPEMLRAAVSETARYDRVTLTEVPTVSIEAGAVIDIIHLLAELLDNATAAGTGRPVTVFAGIFEDGRVGIEIRDQGPGLPFSHRALVNARLSGGLPHDPNDPSTGLRIVALLAARHGIEVRLTEPASGGLTATVILPDALTVDRSDDADETAGSPQEGPEQTSDEPAGYQPGTVGTHRR
jgi:signal transduction histidine kinase